MQELYFWKKKDLIDAFPDKPYQNCKPTDDAVPNKLVISPKTIIPRATIENYQYFGDYIGSSEDPDGAEMELYEIRGFIGFSWGFGIRLNRFQFSYGNGGYMPGKNTNAFTIITRLDDFKKTKKP